METINFRNLEWSEYKCYRYEADINGRVCIFDQYTNYLTNVDTTEDADNFVDGHEELIRKNRSK